MPAALLNRAAWQGRPVVVLGLARSGLAAVRLLLALGARVTALERAPDAEFAARWAPLAERGAELIAGPHPLEVLAGCQALIRSPGVGPDVPLLAAARAQGVPVLSEVALACEQVRTPLLAVTGTNGKSTTTAWAAHLLRRAGVAAVACGNIGRALADAVLEEDAATIFVVEVSSFQLEDSPALHPRAAAILNITPDHLDRHGTLEAYRSAKWAIARNQDPGDCLVLGPEVEVPASLKLHARPVRIDLHDPDAPAAVFQREGRLIWRHAGGEQEILPPDRLALPGPHNLLNGMAAFALATGIVDDPTRTAAGLRDFPGLEHRLEGVTEVAGVSFVNDSKATNVDSLRVALESFRQPVVLIAGGREKAADFTTLAVLAGQRVRHLVAIGEAADRLREAWPAVPAEGASSIEEAVVQAFAAADGQGVVLLSPGCASFDMFRDYEQRGRAFKTAVRALAARVTEER